MWHLTANRFPPNNTTVDVKIDNEDGRGPRNECRLYYSDGIWWHESRETYVYFAPTHWKEVW